VYWVPVVVVVSLGVLSQGSPCIIVILLAIANAIVSLAVEFILAVQLRIIEIALCRKAQQEVIYPNDMLSMCP